MNAEQLEQANKINKEIALIDEMEKEVGRFKKTRFTGALPTSVSRFIASDSSVALEVVDNVWDMAMMKREELKLQLSKI
jgi:hypothetical protein